jgi:hypothetical protein
MLNGVPCPSCGERPTVRDMGDCCYYAMCNCVINKQNKNKYSFIGITPEKAILAWNNYFQPVDQKGNKCQRRLTMRLKGLENLYGPSSRRAEMELRSKKSKKS